ncbi:MAG: hypothetical protein C0621_03930 [Desulfuromonas sp.]|nr:MAG: hypothetical protein C0621_03930 [Desulfuromonas sp.]
MARAKVLLASGEAKERDTLQEILADLDLILLLAEDGPSLLQMVAQQRPQLVIMATDLPGKSGVECCWQLRGRVTTRALPIVLLTDGHSWDADAALAAGCSEILSRPLDTVRCISLAHKLLGSIERRESRVSCRAMVHCRHQSGSFYGSIEDISPRGMFIGSSELLPVEEEVKLRFFLPWQQSAPLSTEARVAWVNRGRQRQRSMLPEGFGVVFYRAPETLIDEIDQFIEHGLLLLNPPDKGMEDG